MPNLRVAVFRKRPFGGVHQNTAVRIEQSWITLSKDDKRSSVLEIGPSGAIRQCVGVYRGTMFNVTPIP